MTAPGLRRSSDAVSDARAKRVTSHIVAMGGGGIFVEDKLSGLGRYILDLSGKQRPTVCWIGTASGDDPATVARIYGAFDDVV